MLALTAGASAQRADSVVTINEIHYHPAGEEGAEWIELHNQMAVRVDLSGWRFSSGVAYSFPEGSVMEPRAHWVVASNPSDPGLAGVTHVFGPFSGALDNGGEVLRLRNRNGRIMDELEYGDSGKWPVAPDGGGVTLCKWMPETASGDARSWTWSAQRGGTPGASNFVRAENERAVRVLDGGTVWKFDTSGDDQDPSWRLPGFDDGTWRQGSTPFATGLLQNPSFESETFTESPGYVSGNSPITGWQTLEGGVTGGMERMGLNTPGVLDPFANNGMTPDGNNVAFIRGGVRSLMQRATGLEVGSRYLLSYRENGRSPTRPVGSASLGGIEVVPQHVAPAVDSLDVLVEPYHRQVGAVFTATARTHEIRLTNHSGLSDTILYDAVRLDPVRLFHRGAGAAAIHRSYSGLDDVVILRALVDPGRNGDGVRIGFKGAAGDAALDDAGVLWLSLSESGELVLRADEGGGNRAVAFSPSAPVSTGALNRVALVWERAKGRAAVVVNEETVIKNVNLHATAGGVDSRFDPVVAGVGASFDSMGGNLEELAVATGGAPATTLPIPVGPTTYRWRTEFEISEQVGRDLLLRLATIGGARVFLNGVEVVEKTRPGSESVLVDGDALRAGGNALAVEMAIEAGEQERSLDLALSMWPDAGPRVHRGLRLSEISEASSESFFIEVENAGSKPMDMAGISLNGIPLPSEVLPAGAHRAYSAEELGIQPRDEEIVFLRDDGERVLDAERVRNRVRAFDPSTEAWQNPEAATPGERNLFQRDSRIVINEIHYHQRPTYADPARGIAYAEGLEEWIELHNHSTEDADLTGWSMRDGVRYDFPAGTLLAAGGFLVVSNAEFSGSLSNRGERLHLLDANNNTVDEVEYLDGAPWPRDADGRGATLELRHPIMDNRDPQSWAASDESAKTQWQEIRYRGRGGEPPGSNNPGYFHEFLMGMLAAGDVLVDDLSVVEDPDGAAIELIQNGSFESDRVGSVPEKWRILGNHQASRVVLLEDGGKALRLVASGRLEHSYNIASTTFANRRRVDSGKTYEISFRARWLSGSPQLNTRLYFNRLARTHILTQPEVAGTPGAANSALEPKAPPGLRNLRHVPLVPRAGEQVRIQVDIEAPGGVASAVVNFNAGAGWESVSMTGNSLGEFVGILPPHPVGTVVQFYVEAVSESGAVALDPPAGAESRALFRVGDRLGGERAVHSLRLITLPADAAFMHTAHHTPSNRRIGATVIYNDHDVWYDAGIRLRGSAYGRRGGRVGWNVQFPAGNLFRGVHETVAIDGGYSVPRGDGGGWLQVGPGVATNELVYNQMAHRAGGVPASYDDVVEVEAPRAGDDKLAQLKMARFGDIWKSSSFDGGDQGTSFKFELVYHPTTTLDGNPESLKSTYNAVLGVDIRNMGGDKEAYRHNFWIQNHRDRDDYTPVILAGRALGASPSRLRAATDEALDVENWLRVMAFQALTMTLDSYNNGLPHNMLLFGRPSDGKTMWIPWDVDHAFYASPSSSIFGIANGDFARVVQIPANRRSYCGHLLDLCTTGFHPAYIGEWVTHFNEVGELPIANHYTRWIADRRNFVLAQVNALHPPQEFRIMTNGGLDFEVNEPLATLRGKGWIDVHEIRVGSEEGGLEVFWIDNNDWEVVVPLRAGANRIELVAYSRLGEEVGRDFITVTNSGTLEPASSQNLVVSEIMYHPSDPTGHELAAGFANDGFFEFIELENIGNHEVDLGGVRFVEGIQFDFSTGGVPVLAPGERVLLVRDETAFALRYGGGHSIAGEFQGGTALSNGGERLRIVGATGRSIQDFSYHDAHPWPEGADGEGYSIVLVDPASGPDHALPGNWRHSGLPGGNPGTSDALVFEGDPLADDDGDGLSNYMNFALGATGAGAGLRFVSEQGALVLEHTRNLGADEVRFAIELSSDLMQWSPLDHSPVSEVALGDGRSLLRWRLPVTSEHLFARLRVIGN